MYYFIPFDKLRFRPGVAIRDDLRPTPSRPLVVRKDRHGTYDVLVGNASINVCKALRSVPCVVLRLALLLALLVPSVASAWPRDYHNYQYGYSRFRRFEFQYLDPYTGRFERQQGYYYRPFQGPAYYNAVPPGQTGFNPRTILTW